MEYKVMPVFEIKLGRKWEKVRSESTHTLSEYCKNNNVKNWRMIGMQSIDEMCMNKYLPIV